MLLVNSENKDDKRIRAKICGLRNPEHALVAAECGADAVGLMFYAPSVRNVTPEQARDIADAVAGQTTRVGVFVNPVPEFVETVLNQVSLDALQFHGDEQNSFCASWGIPWFKALRVAEDTDVSQLFSRWPGASAFLLDSYAKGVYGGTGESFNWDIIPRSPDRPIILAGGLKPGNVAQAIQKVQPWALDVSSGVEQSRGVKSEALIREFMKEVNNVRASV